MGQSHQSSGLWLHLLLNALDQHRLSKEITNCKYSRPVLVLSVIFLKGTGESGHMTVPELGMCGLQDLHYEGSIHTTLETQSLRRPDIK